ncbi:MAG: hypothetical protein ACI8W7_005033, partial [Gammaproteobacteria bacterium]
MQLLSPEFDSRESMELIVELHADDICVGFVATCERASRRSCAIDDRVAHKQMRVT